MLGGADLGGCHPLRLNVGFLLHEGVGVSRDFDFDQPSLLVGDELPLLALRGTIRLSRVTQGLLARGRLQAETPLQCVRCLAEYHQLLTCEVDELLVFPPLPEADALLVIPETGILDLEPLLRETLLLELPLQPLCRPDCTGLCPVCGEDRKRSSCHHPEEQVDPRMAVLKSLLSEPDA